MWLHGVKSVQIAVNVYGPWEVIQIFGQTLISLNRKDSWKVTLTIKGQVFELIHPTLWIRMEEGFSLHVMFASLLYVQL